MVMRCHRVLRRCHSQVLYDLLLGLAVLVAVSYAGRAGQ